MFAAPPCNVRQGKDDDRGRLAPDFETLELARRPMESELRPIFSALSI